MSDHDLRKLERAAATGGPLERARLAHAKRRLALRPKPKLVTLIHSPALLRRLTEATRAMGVTTRQALDAFGQFEVTLRRAQDTFAREYPAQFNPPEERP